jgi:aryl-alcohol dehydrogenase-like predicted oxidoreductase
VGRAAQAAPYGVALAVKRALAALRRQMCGLACPSFPPTFNRRLMLTRPLGRSPLEISAVVLGGNVFGWTIDDARSFEVLDAFAAAGGNCIDTADVYSTWVAGHHGGESETIIGKWMKRRGNRDRVIVATKLGSAMGPEMKGLSAGYIVRAVEASLTRLQTDYIDLYQAHEDDPTTPLEETLIAFGRLITQGKVRVIGASNYSEERLRKALDVSRAHSLARYDSVQPKYNLYDRADFEGELQALCLREEVGVIPYYGLASGFLTGKYRTERDLAQSVRGQNIGKRYLNKRGLGIVKALDEVAHSYHTSAAAVALAWLIAQPGITAPIASATTTDHVRDLAVATELQLDEGALATLTAAGN